MSRLRTIKPGFFLDDRLAECEPLARILFAGLWTIADREGRLEDRPRRIKAETLPYDECDVEQLLDQLNRTGFIVRYEVCGQRFIAIPTWFKHQSPHQKEAPSTIPAPDEHGASTIQAPYEPPSSCLGSCLGSGVLEPESRALADASAPAGAVASVDVADSDADFAEWWTVYGKIGSKADAMRLYRFWRGKGATAEDLLTAARHYRAHCERTDCKMQHARTFLAKPPKGERARWLEWAEGEEHGSMDVAGDDDLAAVLRAGAQTYGGHHDGPRSVRRPNEPARPLGRGQDDRLRVPAQCLDQGD